MWTQHVGNRSFTLGYAVVQSAEGSPVAEGSTAQVWLDAEGRPAALDDVARTALLRSLEEQPGG
ncbi:MAG: hypothetical protein EPO16_03585 [Dehalococcoidia bacterium]|nr:MAG: hypothetical protein EPO16_03585 [Dehalococcoidia bacterium]